MRYKALSWLLVFLVPPLTTDHARAIMLRFGLPFTISHCYKRKDSRKCKTTVTPCEHNPSHGIIDRTWSVVQESTRNASNHDRTSGSADCKQDKEDWKGKPPRSIIDIYSLHASLLTCKPLLGTPSKTARPPPPDQMLYDKISNTDQV